MSQIAFRSHPEEDALELYCLGRLDEDKSGSIEEHLLTCAQCQDRVQELDSFLKAAKIAAREVRQEDRYRASKPAFQWFGKPAWVTAAALAVGLVVVVPQLREKEPQSVSLSAYRGETAGTGTAEAGRPLQLQIDLKGIPPGDCCVIEVADRSGKVVATGPAKPENESAQFNARSLDAGRYWIRVKTTSGDPLRETALEVK